MADRSAIQWTDATWNPIVGCSLVSPGCTHCYAMPMAARIERMQPGSHYAGTTMPSAAGPVWAGKVALAPDHILTQPLRWRRPRKIFVNSMGDLFHPGAPDAWIDLVFAVMALCPQHDFQVLTKRSARMRKYFEGRCARYTAIYNQIFEGALSDVPIGGNSSADARVANMDALFHKGFLPNVWLGVTAEDQARADERIPDLLATPAAIRFASCEPLLGAVRLDRIEEWADKFEDCGGHPDPHWPRDTHDWTWFNALTGQYGAEARSPAGERLGDIDVGLLWDGGKLDLVIAGGESGPRARPMHPDWARALRDQCAAAGTAFFFKQWGEWLDERLATAQDCAPGPEMFDGHGAPKGPKWRPYDAGDRNGGALICVGKARAGRLLDGIEHNDLPRRAAA